MTAEFQILLPKLLTICNGSHPRVVMAALISAAATAAVASCDTKEDAGKFLMMCLRDAMIQLPAAFDEKDRRANGTGTRDGSQGEDQGVAN